MTVGVRPRKPTKVPEPVRPDPEFHRRSLEALRQPLESGQVTLSRALNSTISARRIVREEDATAYY